LPSEALKNRRKINEISKLKVIINDEERVEQKLNKLAYNLKIPFSVVVDKNARSKKEGPLGSTNLETRTIYIHRYKNYNDALRTFLHEVIEAKLNPVFKVLLTLLNAQNELLSQKFTRNEERKIIDTYQQKFLQESFYAIKEQVIDELVEIIVEEKSLDKDF